MILPESGDSFPRMRARSVDFPAPFGPTRPIRSPRFTCTEASANKVRPPNALLTPEIESIRKLQSCHASVAQGKNKQQNSGRSKGGFKQRSRRREEADFRNKVESSAASRRRLRALGRFFRP